VAPVPVYVKSTVNPGGFVTAATATGDPVYNWARLAGIEIIAVASGGRPASAEAIEYGVENGDVPPPTSVAVTVTFGPCMG
jgi:hypothetical protein